MKYRKKPVVIDAFQWTGEEIPVPEEFADMGYFEHENGRDLIISTLEGDMLAKEGDYIIKGIKGEFYPCKPDIFKASYEKVDNE